MSLTINLEAAGLRGYREEAGTPDGCLSFKERLGKGAEGSVYLAVPANLPMLPTTQGRRSRQATRHVSPVAVKVVTGDAFQRYCQTRCLWPLLVHPNIVFPRKAIFDEKSSQCFVEMELCETDLLDLVMRDGPLSDEHASTYAGQLALALAHCHGQGIAHQDVKLENVFILDGVAKLGDLGSIIQVLLEGSTQGSAMEAISPSSRRPGTFYSSSPSPFPCSTIYAPPEAFENATPGRFPCASCEDVPRHGQNDPQCHSINAFASDMWSLGIVLYAAVAKCHPWERACRSDRKFERFLQDGRAKFFPGYFSPAPHQSKRLDDRELQLPPVFDSSLPKFVPLSPVPYPHPRPGLKSLLSRLLCVDPVKRATALEVLDSPWVTQSASATLPPPGKTLVGTHGISIAWPRVLPTPVTPSDYTTDATDIDSSSEPGSPSPFDHTPIPISSLSTTKRSADRIFNTLGAVCTPKARARRLTMPEPIGSGNIRAEMSAEVSGNVPEAGLPLDPVATKYRGAASKEAVRVIPSSVDTTSVAVGFATSSDDLPQLISSPLQRQGTKRPVPTTFGTRTLKMSSEEPTSKKSTRVVIGDIRRSGAATVRINFKLDERVSR